MTDMTPVKGGDAHPLYRQINAETGFAPRWNFNKVLFAPDGKVIAMWGSRTSPTSAVVRRTVSGAVALL